MRIIGMLRKIERILYKKELENRVGKKCPTVKVMGKLTIENVNLKIGNNVILYPDVTFSGNGEIVVGDDCKIGKGVIIYAHKSGGVSIGNKSIIAAQTYIIDSNHSIERGMSIQSQPLISEKIEIGEDVWIGANVTVVKGAKIGDGSVIGAKSLVNNCIDSEKVAFGIPAKVYKDR